MIQSSTRFWKCRYGIVLLFVMSGCQSVPTSLLDNHDRIISLATSSLTGRGILSAPYRVSCTSSNAGEYLVTFAASEDMAASATAGEGTLGKTARVRIDDVDLVIDSQAPLTILTEDEKERERAVVIGTIWAEQKGYLTLGTDRPYFTVTTRTEKRNVTTVWFKVPLEDRFGVRVYNGGEKVRAMLPH